MKREETVEHLFGESFPTNEGFRANCPNCGDSEKKFYYNTEKNVGCCFHSNCSWNKEQGGATEYRIRAYLRREGIQYRTSHHHKITEEPPKDDANILPEGYQLLADCDSGEMVQAYLETRGLRSKTLRRMKVGYCESGRFKGYIIFPVLNAEEEVIYWQGRQFKERKSKFYNPKASNKKEIFYQIGGNYRSKKIILVESIINALTLDTGAPPSKYAIIALLGKNMSDFHREHILSYERNLEEVIIALDPDATATGTDSADIAQRLSGYGFLVYIAVFPKGQDINSVGSAKAWQVINSAIRYNSAQRTQTRSNSAPTMSKDEGRNFPSLPRRK